MTITEALDQLHEAIESSGYWCPQYLGDDEEMIIYAIIFLGSHLEEAFDVEKEKAGPRE